MKCCNNGVIYIFFRAVLLKHHSVSNTERQDHINKYFRRRKRLKVVNDF